jgi:hypothetical protein
VESSDNPTIESQPNPRLALAIPLDNQIVVLVDRVQVAYLEEPLPVRSTLGAYHLPIGDQLESEATTVTSDVLRTKWQIHSHDGMIYTVYRMSTGIQR